MAIEVSRETQVYIRQQLLLKFDKACRMNASGTGTPVWKSIFFILDHLARGDFYGSIVLKILGCVVKDPKVVERTFKVDEMYRDIENGMPRAFTDAEQEVLAGSLDDISQAVAEVIPEAKA